MSKRLIFLLQIVVYCLFFLHTVSSKETSIRFDHLSTEDGLSSSTVFSIVQDQQGFLWFGTMHGLHKYDGYHIEVFKNDPNDSSSVSNNNSGNLFVDSKGFLWIGTWGDGLDKFDPVSGKKIKQYFHGAQDTNTISGNRVQSLFEDSQGYLWFGTYKDGLNRFNPQSGKFIHFKHQAGDPSSLSNNRIWSINEDQHGRIWLATSNGVNVYTPGSDGFKQFFHQPNNPESLSSNWSRVVYIDMYGGIWIGTQNGLNRYHPDTDTFTRYLYKPDAKNQYGWFTINSVLRSKTCGDSILWVGTTRGFIRLNVKTGNFIRYQYNKIDPNSLSANDVRDLYEDKSGIIWIATRGGGVNKFYPTPQSFNHYAPDVNNPNSLSSSRVWAIQPDYAKRGEEIVWIGTDYGLNRWDKTTNTFKHYFNNPNDPHSISNNEIWSIYRDEQGTIWLGSRSGLDRYNRKSDSFTRFDLRSKDASKHLGGISSINKVKSRPGYLWLTDYSRGLFVFNPETNELKQYLNDPKDSSSISHSEVWCVYEDGHGNVWIGTGDGLNLMDIPTGTFKRIPAMSAGQQNHFRVYAIHEDKNHYLWLATDNGLWRFHIKTKQFLQFSEKDGLPDQRIVGILEDSAHNLWLSTNKGLCRFNPETFQSKIYGTQHGLQSNEFLPGAYRKSPKGEFFFGGVNGFNIFFPDKLSENRHPPEVFITDLKIFNQSVRPSKNKNGILRKPLSVTRFLELPSRYNVFSLEFVALDFVAPKYNRYAYMLEGFDPDWIYTDATRRYVTYTNLDPGEYTFRVKASNSDQIWNEAGAVLGIVITPPFWKTWWFRITGILFAVLVGYVLYSTRIKYIKNQKALLKDLVEKRTSALQSEIQEHKKTEKQLQEAIQVASEANMLKSQFLANMSHEIRTPMNGVIGMIHLLKESGLNQEQKEYVSLLNRSANFLMEIINDILDFSKIEAGGMELENIDFKLGETIENICELAAIKASEKKLQFYCLIKNDIPDLLKGDPLRLRQILLNLISNAIKFTEKGGISIEVAKIKENDQRVKLAFSVHDTGIGIPPDAIGKLFRSFSQVDGSTTRKYGGTGLGLAISKELVDLMGGTIKVKSDVGKGSTFWIILEFDKQTEIVTPSSRPDLSGKRALIANPYSGNLAVLEEYLNDFKCRVLSTQSLAEMMLFLEKEEAFDFVFTDIELPGFNEAILTSLSKYSLNKLILTAPVGTINPYQEFVNKGACSSLTRPIKRTALKQILNNQYAEKSGNDLANKATVRTDEPEQEYSILLAEDNLINQKLIIRLVEKMGYKIHAVVNGKLAIEALKEESYDLVLMDLQMPEMDGIKAAQYIRQKDSGVINPQIPIVALTANIRKEDREACFAAGMNDFLTKPIKIEELKNTLRKHLSSNPK
ncbi:MAG TPA: hybrid sensor histidine kinase/response regulator [Caldithrix abyssi]|uniref:Sensory/regulatory protein RpfC n=1 Tax=Caldithrix abyssi TaxID=187145 RepID=A0A7V4TZM4_CALAY|nr:hybrid sensor histidine kinase/response regulator [Caldithrix abyssi]